MGKRANTEKYKDGKTRGSEGAGGGEKKGQRTTGHARSQSCAHFFSRPNPKTLLCPPKINYPPYSKNETAMNKEEPRLEEPLLCGPTVPASLSGARYGGGGANKQGRRGGEGGRWPYDFLENGIGILIAISLSSGCKTIDAEGESNVPSLLPSFVRSFDFGRTSGWKREKRKEKRKGAKKGSRRAWMMERG